MGLVLLIKAWSCAETRFRCMPCNACFPQVIGWHLICAAEQGTGTAEDIDLGMILSDNHPIGVLKRADLIGDIPSPDRPTLLRQGSHVLPQYYEHSLHHVILLSHALTKMAARLE